MQESKSQNEMYKEKVNLIIHFGCKKPQSSLLLTSYLCNVNFGIIHIVITSFKYNGDFLYMSKIVRVIHNVTTKLDNQYLMLETNSM